MYLFLKSSGNYCYLFPSYANVVFNYPITDDNSETPRHH